MAPNRLFVDEILSIGIVSKGDNPEASVALFKARPANTVSLAASRRQLAKSRAYREKYAKERREQKMKNSSETIGELVTKAIDARARAWHLEGRFFDKSLPSLRTQIRNAQPALVTLERSTESLTVVKSRVSGDPDLRKALDFLSEWG